jgi:hypothetical protein
MLSFLEGAAEPAKAAQPSFKEITVDPSMAGDVKLVGDIDKDGRPDLVVAGNRNEGARWYKYPGLKAARFATPIEEFSLQGKLEDVDHDGDLDMIVGDGRITDNLVWLENPLPAGDPAGSTWQRHVIGQAGAWIDNLLTADFDRDGRRDVAVLAGRKLKIFFRLAAGGWQRVAFGSLPLPREGLGSGDLDDDGAVDLVLKGAWLRNPGTAAARSPASWSVHAIGPSPDSAEAIVADIDGDGHKDVVFSNAEATGDVRWWRAGDPRGQWVGHVVLPGVERAHTLQAGDVDGDGDTDLLIGQLVTSKAKRVMVLYNADGHGGGWTQQTISTQGMHKGVLTDVDGDGDLDVFGANFTTHPPTLLFLNGRKP